METNQSLEIVKHQIITETQAASYQKLLQAAENIVFDKNSLNMDYLPLKELSEIEKRLKEKENPHTAAWKQFNEAKASILNPITEILMRKRNEFAKLANEIKEEKQKTDTENKRITDIKALIIKTGLDFASDIAAANTIEELARIEKLIGSEKTKKVYQEFIPKLIVELDRLRPLIKVQKDTLKELMDVSDAMGEAGQFEQDEKFLMLSEKEDELRAKLSGQKNEVQHTALESAMNVQDVEAVNTTVGPDPKRRVWTYEITDFELFKKSFPALVKCEPDHDKIKDEIKILRETKNISEKEYPGWKIYQKSTY